MYLPTIFDRVGGIRWLAMRGKVEGKGGHKGATSEALDLLARSLWILM